MNDFNNKELYGELNRRFTGGSGMQYSTGNTLSTDPKPERSEEGGLWFVVLTPLIGLVLQSFAISKWAGIYLWAMIVAALYIGTIIDLRSVKENHPDVDTQQLRKYILIPPVYVYHREKLLGHETFKAFVLGALIFAALAMNNFVMSMRINTDSIPEMIEGSVVGSLDNFNGNSSEFVGDKLVEWLGEDYTADCTKEGNTYTASFTGTHEGTPYVIEIAAVHDGFVYQSFEVTGITVDGKKLEDDEFSDMLTEIFLPEDAQEDETQEDAEDTEDTEETEENVDAA